MMRYQASQRDRMLLRAKTATRSALLVCLCLCFAAVHAQTPEKPHVLIAVGGKAGLYYLPLTIAEQLGYFKDEGLQVEISDFAGGAKSLEALIGGSADVVAGAYEHTIDMQSKNQPIRAFVLMGRAPQISIGVVSAKAAQVKGPADLKGMRIGVSAPGSSTNVALDYYLAQGGVKPNEVSVIGVGSSAAALSAARSGQIDAICNVEPVMTMLEQHGDIRILADARTLKGTQELFGGQMPAATLYAFSDFVKKYPHTMQALTNAIVRAERWLQHAGPAELLKTVPETYLLGDRALYLASFDKVHESYSPDGLIPEAGTRTALKVLAAFNPRVDAAHIRLDETFTNEFVMKADARWP